jgi:formamidopyrimidine-DNA glycosylase
VTNNERLLSVLNSEYGDGSDDPMDMIRHAVVRDYCPGICTKCEGTFEDVEPDTTTYWCEQCQENSVTSCLILAGLI